MTGCCLPCLHKQWRCVEELSILLGLHFTLAWLCKQIVIPRDAQEDQHVAAHIIPDWPFEMNTSQSMSNQPVVYDCPISGPSGQIRETGYTLTREISPPPPRNGRENAS